MMNYIIYIILTSIFDLVGSLLAKQRVLTHIDSYLRGTVIAFGITGYFLAQSLQFEGLAIANITWIVLAIIITTGGSYVLFHEQITSVQLLGIVIVIIGVVIVNLP